MLFLLYWLTDDDDDEVDDEFDDDDHDNDDEKENGDALSTLLTCRPLRFEVASTSIFGPQGQSHWMKGVAPTYLEM